MYQHGKQLVKNSLMEGLIRYANLIYLEKLTENEARKIVRNEVADSELLERRPDNLRIYRLVRDKFKNIFES